MKIEMEFEEFNRIAQALGNLTKLLESNYSSFPPNYSEEIQILRRKLLTKIGYLSAIPEKIDLND